MRSKAITSLVTCLVITLILAACSPTVPNGPGNQTPRISPSPAQTTSIPQETKIPGDTSWILKSLGDPNNMTPALPGRIITLQFHKTGGYSGSDGNRGNYGGAYNTGGNNITFGATTFAGFTVPDDPPGFLKQHQTYFSLLLQAHDFKIMDDELLINCSGGKSLLFYRAMHSTQVASPSPTIPVTAEPSSIHNNGWKSFTTRDAILGLVTTGNKLWATTSGGVIQWDLENGKERKYATQDGLASDQVRKIIRDSQGNIWVTCYVSGVSRFNGEKWDSFNVKNGLCSDDTIALASDRKGGVWVSAYWGVSYFDGRQWSSYSNVSPDEPAIGGPNPMKDCRNLTLVDGELGAADVIFVDSRGNIWFSSRARGVTRYDGQEWRLFTNKDGLGTGGIYTIFEDKDGIIWFDSYTGMTSFDGAKFTFRSIPAFQSVVPRPIGQDILQDNRGNLWLAAYGGGVVKFDGKDWQAFSVQDGLPGINAQDLFLNQDGYPGVITDKGVSRFDGSAWQVMTAADGLPEGKVRVVINDDKGNLWFGAEGGVSYHDK
jgi:ligand-binding sensor domain-containing protein